MGLIFPQGKFSQRMPYREKRENYPHAEISTFTVSKEKRGGGGASVSFLRKYGQNLFLPLKQLYRQ